MGQRPLTNQSTTDVGMRSDPTSSRSTAVSITTTGYLGWVGCCDVDRTRVSGGRAPRARRIGHLRWPPNP